MRLHALLRYDQRLDKGEVFDADPIRLEILFADGFDDLDICRAGHNVAAHDLMLFDKPVLLKVKSRSVDRLIQRGHKQLINNGMQLLLRALRGVIMDL